MEVPSQRLDDISGAIDFLVRHPHVDPTTAHRAAPAKGRRTRRCRSSRRLSRAEETGMTGVTATITAMSLLAAASLGAQPLIISRAGSRPVRPAPSHDFTGDAQVEMLFEAVEPSDASGGSVTFEPGARTAWHTHPRGQILIVTAGVGRVQRWGDPVEEIRAGDVVRIAAGQKHWHGASPQASMTHIAISERRDGSTVRWMEQVTDEQYGNSPSTSDERLSSSLEAQGSSPPPAQSAAAPPGRGRPSGPLQQKLAPGMALLTDDVLYGDVWRRSGLSPRDRSLVTITALIAIGEVAPLAGHLGRALDNGVRPSEASGLLAHLAIYCGWPKAVAALDVFDQVYTERKVDTGTLRATMPRLPALASDAARAKAVADDLGAVAPQFVQLTNEVVFDDLWRRPDLGPRDRSLVTIAALAGMGDDDDLDRYVRRGVESGLTREQIVEAVTHLGFYAGWAKATKAMMVAARTFGK
jgi:4-carboxymuconolactone decarboxylase